MSPDQNRPDPDSRLAADRNGYDPVTDTIYAQYDAEDGENTLILSLVGIVAELTGREETELTPLYNAVDPTLINAALKASRDSEVEITFTYENCCVTLTSVGELIVDPNFDHNYTDSR